MFEAFLDPASSGAYAQLLYNTLIQAFAYPSLFHIHPSVDNLLIISGDTQMLQQVTGLDPYFHFTGVLIRSIRSLKWR